MGLLTSIFFSEFRSLLFLSEPFLNTQLHSSLSHHYPIMFSISAWLFSFLKIQYFMRKHIIESLFLTKGDI